MKTNSFALCLLILSPAALTAAVAQIYFRPLSFDQSVGGELTDRQETKRDFMATDNVRLWNTDVLPIDDHLIPQKGKAIATFATGIPFAGIAEVTYGFTNRFSVGVIAGLLDNLAPGYGLHFRYILTQPSKDFRIYFKAPVIYYPKARNFGCPDCDPWFLTWPAVNAEWRLTNESRLWTGVGLVAAACATTVFGGQEKKEHMAKGLHEGEWNTLQFGFSRPIARGISFQIELSTVLKGLKLATSRNWVGRVPVILTTGISRAF
jgi:hypothetical protein